MAKNAAKKAARAQQELGSVLKLRLIVINLVLFGAKLFWKRFSLSAADVAALLPIAAGHYVGYAGQVAAAGTAGQELYFDVTAVTTVTQLLCVFSNYGLLLFLSIPAYAAYYFLAGGKAKGGAAGAREPVEDAATAKRNAKKERKQARMERRMGGRR